MKKYKKIFLKYWGYGEQDIISCWGCFLKPAVDIHHLVGRGRGGDPQGKKDKIDNLVPLCRECHIKTDIDKVFNNHLKQYIRKLIGGV